MKTNSSFHAAGEVATQPAWGTGEQAAQPLNGSTSRFAMSESSLADLLQKAASQYPNRAAYKFIDYDTDPAGFTETVTWWQVHRRAMIVAEELWIYASSGDRVAILAPQGLEYIIAFMGVLQAGLIAVPLPVPQFGIHDERISSALRDSAPSIILTTSSVIDEVTTYAPHACAAQGQSAPIVVAVDALDLSSSRALDPTRFERPSTAYLQYTSGSTRAPAGVVLSHKNVITNCVQLMSDYIGDSEKVPSTPVSWLPFYHDMGLMLGIILPMINQDTAVLIDHRENDAQHQPHVVIERHGVDAGHHSPDDQSRHRGVDESHGILAAAGPLDAIISQTPRTDFQRTEFRFRIGGTQNIRRRYGWT